MGFTIKDIAKACNVSITTVSRVLNNNGYVKEDTRDKILSAVSEYNYIPNNSARSLKIKNSKNIALLVKGVSNPFFNFMTGIIEQKLALRGYSLLLQNIEQSASELDIAIKEQQDRNLCGVMLMGGSFSYSQDRFSMLGIPCVILTVSAKDDVPKELYSSVCIDDEKEGFRATEYLIKLGHKRIGFIFLSSFNALTPNHKRYLGYLRALETYGIAFDNSLVANDMGYMSLSGYKVGFSAMRQLCMRNRDMTAVFAYSDILAIGAAKAALSLGYSIPNNISIIGFDGIEEAEYYNPSLDTMYQPSADMAMSAIEILFDMMQGGDSQHLVYDAVIMKRGSCKQIGV